MGVNISGSGILSGIASLVMGAVNNLNLLVTRIIGYTNTGGGGSSYYTTTVASIDPGYLAVSNNGQVIRSFDGYNWNSTTSVSSSYGDADQYYLNDKFYTFGGGGGAISSDGATTWVNNQGINSIITSAPSGSFLSTVVKAGNRYYAYVRNNDSHKAMFTSSDLENWSQVNGISDDTYEFQGSFGNNVYVLISKNSGQTYYSNDGLNFTLGTAISTDEISGINFINGLFLAYAGAGRNKISVSTDGAIWTSSTVSIPGKGQFFYLNNNFVFIGNAQSGSDVYTSVNGTTWTTETRFEPTIEDPFSSQTISPVLYVFNKYYRLRCLTNFNGTLEEISAYYSTNLVDWTKENTPIVNNNPQLFSPHSAEVFENGQGIFFGFNGISITSTNGTAWTVGNSQPGGGTGGWFRPGIRGLIANVRQVQVSIGDQGSGGAEILAPVDIYTVPANKTTDIDEVRIKNNSGNTITYDLAVLDTGVQLTDQNALINDQSVLAGATATVTSINIPMTAGQRIVVFPSAVDVVEVKVYGTESNA